MDIATSMKPFTLLFDWMRTFEMTLYGFTFTFMDVLVWTMLAGIAVWFINELRD